MSTEPETTTIDEANAEQQIVVEVEIEETQSETTETEAVDSAPAEDEQTEPENDAIAFDAELRELFSKMWSLEELCQETEGRVQGLSENLKLAKKRLEDRQSQMRELIRAYHDLRVGNKNDANRPLLNPPCGAEPAHVEEPRNEAWRTIPTEVLLDPPLEGFGAKKRTALLEAVPTLGDFVNLQCRVGRDAATLRELLPKGIGEQAADALEERLLTAIRKYDISDEQPPVAEAVADSPEEAEAEAQLDNESVEEALQQQALELFDLAKSDREKFDAICAELDDNVVAEGIEAYSDDQQVEECPYQLGSEKQRTWVYGWVSQYVDDPDQAIDVTESEEEPGPETKPEPVAAQPVKSAVLTAQQMLDDL